MMQCPEERNTLIYDVIFSEFHQKGYSSPQVTQLNFHKNNVTKCKKDSSNHEKMQISKLPELKQDFISHDLQFEHINEAILYSLNKGDK